MLRTVRAVFGTDDQPHRLAGSDLNRGRFELKLARHDRTSCTGGSAVLQLKIDEHIPKSGDPVAVTFIAPAAGEYEIACSEFCGSGHGQMKAALMSVAAPTRTNR